MPAAVTTAALTAVPALVGAYLRGGGSVSDLRTDMSYLIARPGSTEALVRFCLAGGADPAVLRAGLEVAVRVAQLPASMAVAERMLALGHLSRALTDPDRPAPLAAA